MELAHARSADFLRTVEAEARVRKYLDPIRDHHRETHGHSVRVGLLCVDLGIDGQAKTQSIVDGLSIEHGKDTGVSQAHGANLTIGRRTESGGAPAENFRLGS